MKTKLLFNRKNNNKKTNFFICYLLVNLILLFSVDFAHSQGTLKWSFQTGRAVHSSPAIGQDGTIYVGSYDDKLYAINLDGSLKWDFQTSDDVHSSPAIGQDGTIYVGSEDDKLYAINPDGSLKWDFQTGSAVRSSPAIGQDGTIYVGSDDEKLYAINPDGTENWSFQAGDRVFSSPAIGQDGTIYVGSLFNNKLYAINPDGILKWAFQTGKYVESSPAIGPEGTIYVGSFDDKLYAINPDGSLKWAFRTGDTVRSSPAIGTDGTIYVGSGYVGSFDNKLYAINPDGTMKWAFQTGDEVISSPAIGKDGTIYVGSGDNKIYAIQSSSMGLADTPWPKFNKNHQNTSNAFNVNCPVAIVASETLYLNMGESAKLDGSGSYDPDGDLLFYSWHCAEKPVGSAVVISDSTQPVTNITCYDRGQYRFSLNVTDKQDGTATKSVWINCSVEWSFQTYKRIRSSPAIGQDGTIYVGTESHKLYAINPDGTEKWSFQTGGNVSSSPAIGQNGTIYVGSLSLYAINPDGTEKWLFRPWGENVQSTPAIGQDGTIYVGNESHKLYAINPDGTEKWSFQTGGYVSSSPAIGQNGTIYVGSLDNKIYAINPDGTEKWFFQTGGNASSSPAIGQNGTIYVGSYDNKLTAINPDGSEKWSLQTGGDVQSSPAIGQDGTIYVGSDDAKLYAINPDGSEKWSFQTGDLISSSPAIGQDSTIYVGSKDNKLYAINPNGTEKWSVQTGGYVHSSPAIGQDGTIYVGSDDDKLYALQSSSMGLADSPWPKFRRNNKNQGGYLLMDFRINIFGFLYSQDSNTWFNPLIIFNYAENQMTFNNCISSSPKFKINNASFPFTVAAGDSVNMFIVFQPAETGYYQADMNLFYTTGTDTLSSLTNLWAGAYLENNHTGQLLFQRAIAAYDSAKAYDATSSEAHNNLGVLYTMLTEKDRASDEFAESTTKGTDMNEATLHVLDQNYEEALTEWSALLDNVYTPLYITPQIRYNMAWVYDEIDSLETAFQYYSDVIIASLANNRLRAKAYVGRGVSAYKLASGDTTAAYRDFRQAIVLDPYGAGVIAQKNMLKTIDQTAPSPVSDLAAGTVIDSAITLLWTAPGDDQMTGNASYYDIRFSTSSPDTNLSAWWTRARRVVDEPQPSPAGNQDSVMVSNLSPGTFYYFAMKVGDEAENWSEISNVVEVTTLPTGVITEKTLPKKYRLFQNYPNPFNPSTLIRYELPKISRVKIKVYDMLGREVFTLVDAKKMPGSYQIQWDGTNAFGNRVASGIYIYQIESEQFRKSKKMLLIR